MRALVLFLLAIICFTPIFSLSQDLPIEPARTISVTTNEGSYMNVDVSPDGKSLAFDLLGDLFIVPITGGKATQLTRGLALNLRPVWSPDGKSLAYLSDISGEFHLNIMDLEKNHLGTIGRLDKPLDYGTDAVWTPDSHYILADDSIYGIAGGKQPPISNIKHLIRFSADGQLAYGIDSNRLYRYDLNNDTKTPVSVTLTRYRNGALSPDGRWWCYTADQRGLRSLYALDLTSNTTRTCVPSLYAITNRYYPDVPNPHFSFTPDSKQLLIGYNGKIHRIDLASGGDSIVPFEATARVDLGTYDYNTFRVAYDSVHVKYTRYANASPNGKQLVFSALNKIYLMDLPAGKPRLLVNQPFNQYQPVFSPDGRWIAYVSWCDTAGGDLWRVSVNGGQPEQLTRTAGHYERPAWSPDGTLIAVVKGASVLGERDDPGTGQVELIPVHGGKISVIADSVPLWNNICFSADGRRITFTPKKFKYGSKSEPIQLVSVNLGSKEPHAEVVGSSLSTYYSQKSISPDGRYLVYSADEDLYLVPFSRPLSPIAIFQQRQDRPLIRFAAGVDPFWSQDSKTLSWCYGKTFYQIDPDKIVLAAQKTKQQVQPTHSFGMDFFSVEITPDRVIPLHVSAPAAYGHGMLALTNVRILTMQGNAIIEHGTILIKDGRFLAVGPSSTIHPSANTRVLDLSGTTVMPGIIDLHLHLHNPPNIFPQQYWKFLIDFAYGITTARDPSLNFDSFGYAELLSSGSMLGPRLFSVGRPARFYDGILRCDDRDDAKRLVQKREILGGTFIKQYTLPTRLQRQWLMLACRELRLNITNEGDPYPLLQIAMIKDGSTGIEHNPSWGNVYDDVIDLLKASGTWLTPTLQVCYGAEEGRRYFNYKYWRHPDRKFMHFTDTADYEVKSIFNDIPTDTIDPGFLNPARIDARILHSGGHICLGSHGNDQGIGAHSELWALQMGGMTNMEALQCATIRGAEALGVQKDLGSIEVGKIADLIILNKNPLDDIHNSREIRYVMKDGILYDGNTLDEIWPEQKKCPDWHLHENLPAK